MFRFRVRHYNDNMLSYNKNNNNGYTINNNGYDKYNIIMRLRSGRRVGEVKMEGKERFVYIY